MTKGRVNEGRRGGSVTYHPDFRAVKGGKDSRVFEWPLHVHCMQIVFRRIQIRNCIPLDVGRILGILLSEIIILILCISFFSIKIKSVNFGCCQTFSKLIDEVRWLKRNFFKGNPFCVQRYNCRVFLLLIYKLNRIFY